MSGWSFTSATAWSACTSGQRTRNETWNRTITTQPSGGGAACGVTQEVRVVSEPCTVATTPTAQLTATAGATAGTAKVTWQSTNATAATLNGVAVATSGTAQYNITATTTYTLVVTGPGGTASAFGTVVVAAPVDCVLSTWSLQSASPWGACTGGQQTRTETWTRSIITPPSNGGAACGILQEQRTAAQACTDPTPTAPGSPTSFKATTSGNNVTLGWNVPAAGGAANGYRIWVGATTSWELVNGMDVGNALSRAAPSVPAPTTRASPPSTPSARLPRPRLASASVRRRSRADLRGSRRRCRTRWQCFHGRRLPATTPTHPPGTSLKRAAPAASRTSRWSPLATSRRIRRRCLPAPTSCGSGPSTTSAPVILPPKWSFVTAPVPARRGADRDGWRANRSPVMARAHHGRAAGQLHHRGR